MHVDTCIDMSLRQEERNCTGDAKELQHQQHAEADDVHTNA